MPQRAHFLRRRGRGGCDVLLPPAAVVADSRKALASKASMLRCPNLEGSSRSLPLTDALPLPPPTPQLGQGFGTSSSRFHGLRSGAQNGGGVNAPLPSLQDRASNSSQEQFRFEPSVGNGPGGGRGVRGRDGSTALSEGWVYVVERWALPDAWTAALLEDLDDVVRS